MSDYDWRLVTFHITDIRWKWCTTFDVEFLNSSKLTAKRLHEPSCYTHRDDGPLYRNLNGSYTWVWQGLRYSFTEWCKMAEIDDVEKTMMLLQYA